MSLETLNEKVLALTKVWMDLMRGDHHKDRDCHFFIETIWSYGESPQFEVKHYGYIAQRYEEKFSSYTSALEALVKFLEAEIEQERALQKTEEETVVASSFGGNVYVQPIPLPPPSDFSPEGKSFLEAFYTSQNAITPRQKVNCLRSVLLAEKGFNYDVLREREPSVPELKALEYFALIEKGFDE